jgi:cysteinyl-tRNA synthetase
MHNGFVRVADEKMSKSLGNFFTIREVLARYDAEVVRYLILASHYRSPLNYSDESLVNAKQALTRLYLTLADAGASEPGSQGEAFAARFFEAMDDDFSTPVAISVLFDLAREINRERGANPAAASALAGRLRAMGGILGLLERDPDQFLKSQAAGSGICSDSDSDDAEIEALVTARNAARRNKNWAESDRIRDDLKARGVILEDKQGVSTWRRE